MNWLLPKDASPADVIQFVQEHGIAVLEGYVSDQDLLNKAKDEALAESLKAKSGYKFGKAMRYGPHHINGPVEKLLAISNILADPNCLEIEKLSGKKRQEVFITHEYIQSPEPERNGFLHFDRNSTFKLIFYLMDVNEQCGPFRAIMGTHILGRELRTKEWKRTRINSSIKNRLAIDYPELGYTENDGNPVIGPAGTLIVLDTDTLHKGGLVESQHQRLILRTHCR
jgi:hypothetical protein